MICFSKLKLNQTASPVELPAIRLSSDLMRMALPPRTEMTMNAIWTNRVLPVYEKFFHPDTSLEDKRRATLHIILSLIGIVFLFLFSILAIIQKNIPLATADIIAAMILIGNLFDLYRRKQIRFTILFGVSIISLLYIFLYVSGGIGQSAFVWYFTYPLIACYLLGSFHGIIVTLLMIIPVIVVAFIGSDFAFVADYTPTFEFRFTGAYLVVGFLACAVERHGENNRRELKEINESLENIINARTAELTRSNEQLKKEIDDRIAAENTVRLSQDSLTTIMDSIDATIYVADRESCKILFMNKTMQDLFGQDLSNRICWESVLNSSTPCQRCMPLQCTGESGEDPGAAIWEGINPVTNKWSINVERVFQWVDGRHAFLHIATDISHLKKLQDEREKMEAQLVRAQKMEAIGTLAGGVAHDLNNVLSGITSYPEMLLWNLDNANPMRKPLMTIQKAGEKAAEIVQDLLTLARRGVTTKEVVELNHIISDYVDSPEYAKMMSYHKNIIVTCNLDPTLLHLKGSPIHIRKTIMNLVSNAAEAQPDGGEIAISTYNRNVDLPEKGYENIRQGDFVTLEITDKGCGISEEDKERIFEPFYTKKVMGRSGTGLGMAVVWGTVQDHHGFIDIKSKLNEGTTFYLYFPVTREVAMNGKGLVPVSEYMGQGQLVLIVDDSEEQRIIASSILETLNYKTIAATSGETALECMKKITPDVLLLDMIMEPGMDGLNTYKKAITINPKQKAIIASGFAETDRVKEVQRLGAGPFIRKPYKIETVGLAIHHELRKKQ